MYSHTVLVPKTLTFEPEYYKCPRCGDEIEKHIVCEGARFHVMHWDSKGTHCSEPKCVVNHRHKCKAQQAITRRDIIAELRALPSSNTQEFAIAVAEWITKQEGL